MEFDHHTAIYLHQKINGHRTLPALMHILLGNRTAQTISDMHLFRLERFAGTLKDAPEDVKISFEKILSDIFDQHRLSSERGNVKQEPKQSLPDGFNGLDFEWTGRATHLWKSLSLFIQTLTHLRQNDRFFFPVSTDEHIQNQVKSALKDQSLKRLTDRLYHELAGPLEKMNEPAQKMFIDRLTVKGSVGLSFSQLADQYKMTPFQTYITVRGVLHVLLHAYDSNPPAYPLLAMFVSKGKNRDYEALTDSAKQTKRLLDYGHSLNDVAKARKLKNSTVEDHVVELAHVDPNFDYSPYLKDDDLNDILKQINTHKLTRLRQLKDATDGAYSYLQLRIGLAMARRRLQ